MGDQVALEHTIDRTPEADELAAAGHTGRVRQRAELRARAVVVKQHAAVEVAYHHALRQLGHQRREAILLELDRFLGAPDLGRDVAHQLVALAGELVHGQRQGLHFGRAFWLDTETTVGAEHQAQVLGHAQQTLHVLPEQRPHHADARSKPERGEHRAQPEMRCQHIDEDLPALTLRFRPDDQRRQQEGTGHQQEQHDNGENEARTC